MKKLLVVLFISLSSFSFGQTQGKWSVGVSYTPLIQSGSTFATYLNRHLNKKWQIGLMPFGYFYNYKSDYSSFKSNLMGLNFTSRYVLLQGDISKTYIQAFSGYGYTANTYQDSNNGERKEELDYLNFSVGVGVEIAIGKKGWFGDINLGYLRYHSLSEVDNFNSPMGSIGILKRFGK